MNWLLFWIVLFLILIVILSLRHIRSNDLEQYLVNNRKTKTFPLIATTLATFVGGGTSIGLMAMGYESGFAAVSIGIAYVLGFFIMSRFAGQIRDFGAKNKIYSFPHYLNFIYTAPNDKRFNRLFSASLSGINILIFFFLLSAQFVAMASLLKFTFEINYNIAVIISAIVVIFYTAIAGLSGVIITDMIQFLSILVMIALIFIPGILQDTENLSRLSELSFEMLSGTFYGYGFVIGVLIFISWSVLVRMDIWQRILAAKDAKTAKRVSIISGFGMLPFYILFPLTGMAVRIIATEPISPNDIPYYFISHHSEGILLGFAIIGLLSALMSSGDSFLNIISISAVKDFAGWKNKEQRLESTHKSIKFMTIFFGFLALFMALAFPHIVDLMVIGISTIVIFAPITLLALQGKNANSHRKAALYSLVSGFIVNMGFFIYGILRPENFQAKSSFIPGLLVGIIVLLLNIKKRKKSKH